MGLMGTLAKVAIGYAAARGVDKLAGGNAGGGLGGLLGGGASVPASDPQAAAMNPPETAANPLQDMMGQMMGGGGAEAGSNPLQDMMGSMMGGGGAEGGANPLQGMMDQLGGLMGGQQAAAPAGQDGGGLLSGAGAGGGAGLAGLMAAFGGIAAAQGKATGGLLDQFASKDVAPEADETAALMLRAIIQAAKSDGGIDDAERAKILETVGDDADADDIAFVNAQLEAPVDPDGLAADTPDHQRMQVYSASLMSIRVDTQAEAQYLHTLASKMGLDEKTVNGLHLQMGIQPLYA